MNTWYHNTNNLLLVQGNMSMKSYIRPYRDWTQGRVDQEKIASCDVAGSYVIV